MKKHVKYFISYYGTDRTLWWDNDGKRWIPAGMNLYRSTWDDVLEVFPIIRKLKRKCSGWASDIYVDSYIAYVEGR